MRASGASAAFRRLASLAGVAGLVAFAGLAGCGRKATDADCQLIIDRSVELQMKEMSKGDPESIQKRQAQLRQELEQQTKADCLGRNVSDKMMACVRNAKTSQELEACAK